jgi:excisionase family DNA binding protein
MKPARLLTVAELADDVLDVRGAMALLKVGRDAIYAGCARQEIPHRKIGRTLRFSRNALVRWLDSCGQQGAQKGT